MDAGDVKRFIRGLSDLPTIPGLLSNILSAIRDEDASPDDLHRLISHDQAFAERVIHVANSVLFGHSGDVRDIRQAIMFLGFDRIKSVALGMTVMDMFPSRNSFNIRNLWSHSYEVAFLAEVISDNLAMTSPSECFLSGLLHDIGRIIFYRMNPKKFLDIGISDDLLDRERGIFGCTHADAGAWFAENADMPLEIIETIRFHHKPSQASDDKCALSIVSLAEVLTRRFNPRLEDDGIWTEEHDAILLEFGLRDEEIASVAEKFSSARTEIERFFDVP